MTANFNEATWRRLEILAEQNGVSVDELVDRWMTRPSLSGLSQMDTLTAFFDSSSELACFTNAEGYFVYVSKAFARALVYSPEQLINRLAYDFIEPEDRHDTSEALDILLDQGQLTRFENRFRCGDGRLRWLSWTATVMENGLNCALARDITEAKVLEESLLERTYEMATILESISDAFFALDDNWCFTYLNTEAEVLLRRNASELLTKNVWDEFPEAVGSRFYEEYHRTVREQTPASFIEYYPPLETWFEVKAYPTHNGLSIYFNNVNERVRLEEELRRREETFRALAENNPDAIARLDKQGRYTYINPAFATTFDLKADQAAGAFSADILADLRFAQRLEIAQAIARTNRRETSFEFSLKQSRDERYFEARLVPELDREGEVDSLLLIIRDVTDRRQIEIALRESEARYRAILNSQIDLVCRYTPDTMLTYVNDAYCQYFHSTREALIGRSFLTLTTPDQIPAIQERIQQVLVDPAPRVLEFYNILPNGQKRWIQWVDHGIIDEAGRVTEIQTVGRDVTHLKQIEGNLREQTEFAQSIIDHIPVIVVLMSADMRVKMINRYGEQRLGWTTAEVQADPSIPVNSYQPEDVERAIAQFNAATGEWYDYTMRPASGQSIDISWAKVRLSDGSVLGFGQDITARKELEDQRLYAATLEVELSKEREIIELKERFTSMVSHEFRTPLSVILSSVDIIRRYQDRLSQEDINRRLNGVANQVERMVSLLDDVLAITRANSGKMLFQPEPTDLHEFCLGIVDNMRLADQNLHEVTFTATGIPPLAMIDQRIFTHIITNLLSNAIKYSGPGARVEVSLRRDEEMLVMDVKDEGIGIPPDALEQLFEPFFRAGNARHIEGTGLGLPIVRQNVEAHGGQITCTSKLNEGSHFTITVPLVLPE